MENCRPQIARRCSRGSRPISILRPRGTATVVAIGCWFSNLNAQIRSTTKGGPTIKNFVRYQAITAPELRAVPGIFETRGGYHYGNVALSWCERRRKWCFVSDWSEGHAC